MRISAIAASRLIAANGMPKIRSNSIRFKLGQISHPTGTFRIAHLRVYPAGDVLLLPS
jgi:hypothetical protein